MSDALLDSAVNVNYMKTLMDLEKDKLEDADIKRYIEVRSKYLSGVSTFLSGEYYGQEKLRLALRASKLEYLSDKVESLNFMDIDDLAVLFAELVDAKTMLEGLHLTGKAKGNFRGLDDYKAKIAQKICPVIKETQ